MKPTHILLTALLLTALLCAAPVAADAVTHNGKTYTTYDQIYASTTLSSSEKLSLVQEMAGWTPELEAYMEWKNSGGLEAYQAAVSGGNSTSSDYGWNEAPGDGLGDGGTNIEPEYSYQERQAYDAAYAAYQAEFAENYAATAAYTGSGSGTQADPYIITTTADFFEIPNDISAYYQLGNSLDFTSDNPSTPLFPSSNTYFKGVFDGNGYTISNYNHEMFGYLGDCTIKNICFKDCDYSSSSINSALMGSSCGNVVFDCVSFVDCTVSNSNRGAAAIVGFVSGGAQYPLGSFTANNCFVSGTSISSTSQSTTLDATAFFVGRADRPSRVTINNCYIDSNCAISGPKRAGFVSNTYGGGSGQASITITSSVFLLTASTSARIGPAYGSSYNTLSNNYASSSSTPSSTDRNSVNGANVDVATYQTQTFWKDTLNWDFDTIWYWDDADLRPKLQVFVKSVPPTITSISATPATGGQQDTYTLSVTATASGGIASYQWYGRIGSSGEWQAISDGTSATYQFVPGTYALGDFYFKCVVTGANGGVIDSYDAGFTNVKVTVVLAPQITSPAATPATGPLSQTVQLSADVTSTETATYQWQELIGSTWTNISGATAATATVNIADSASTTHSYRLLATNVGGTTTSATVAYTSVAPPTISSVTANPTTGPLTQSVTLSATVSGATSYQWQEQSGSTWQNIAGATSATQTANIADSAATTHSYRLLATNVGGTTTSATVAYTSVAPPTISSVTANPTTGPLTQSVTLSATVSGATSYQWQEQSGSTWQNIAGATSATYTANIADSASTTHSYRLQATNVGGTTTSATVAYTSVAPPTISSVTANPTTGPLTQTVTLIVSATGAAQYQWQQLTGTTWNNINGATASTHTVSISDNAPTLHSYRVVVSNVGGSITSDTVTYQSSTGPIINTISATPTSGPLTQTVTLTVTATSTNTISYQWQELIGNTWTAISGATTPTYSVSITDTNPTTHIYRVLATDIGGTTPSETITYTSIASPNIQAVNINPAVGKYTETITLSAEVSGADTYQWQQLTGTTWNNISGATTVPWIGTLTVTGDTQYRLLATNAGGTTTSQTIQYTIAGPANIQSLTATPSVVAIPGSTTLQITGTNIVSVEWQKLSGSTWQTIGTGVSLTESITNVGETTFRALVEGADGTTTASNNIVVLSGYAPSVDITEPINGDEFGVGNTITAQATVTGTDVLFEWGFGVNGVGNLNTNPTTITYTSQGYKTITITAESIFGTATDSVTILYGKAPRPMQTELFEEVDTTPVTNFVNQFDVEPGEMPNPVGIVASLFAPFDDALKGFFWVLMFGAVMLVVWLISKNIAIPSVLGILFGSFMIGFMPDMYLYPAVALIAAGCAGGLVYVVRKN